MSDPRTYHAAMLGATLATLLRRMPDGVQLRVEPHPLGDGSQVIVSVSRLTLPDETGQRRTVAFSRVVVPIQDVGAAVEVAVGKLEP